MVFKWCSHFLPSVWEQKHDVILHRMTHTCQKIFFLADVLICLISQHVSLTSLGSSRCFWQIWDELVWSCEVITFLESHQSLHYTPFNLMPHCKSLTASTHGVLAPYSLVFPAYFESHFKHQPNITTFPSPLGQQWVLPWSNTHGGYFWPLCLVMLNSEWWT